MAWRITCITRMGLSFNVIEESRSSEPGFLPNRPYSGELHSVRYRLFDLVFYTGKRLILAKS